ncbi:hypothetical protein [Nonomuraea guangzhouensis]|uniref:Site-specific integrase n=1 Tax=Nonomuraea guangzhouensis TaxID=1291555 RepID=A0ABW4GFP4_9ACTN|nr:hypothetical protein [Nonomuraea guangzhouensis]
MTFDLSDLPCPRLVRHLARALAGIAGDTGSQRSHRTTEDSLRAVRSFVQFVAAVNPATAGEFGLEDLTPELLEGYEHHLLARHGDKSSTPYIMVVAVIKLLRLAAEANADKVGLEMRVRLDFTTTTTGWAYSPLDSYPFPVFEAIEAAASSDVRAIRDRILEGERLAASGQDPEVGGWRQLENILWHVAHRGPLTRGDLDRPDFRSMINRHGGIRGVNSRLFLISADLVPLLVLLICQTGLEPECVKSLRADCLINPGRGFVSIAYVKNRARGATHKTMRVADGGALHYPGGLLRLTLRLTQRGRDLLGTDKLWTHVHYDGPELSFEYRRSLNLFMTGWMRRHGLEELTDRDGGPAHLDMRRLRKTYKSRRYLQTSGVLEDFAEGHTKGVAARHYADIEAHRELHDDAVESGLREALATALDPPVVLDDDGDRLDDGEPLPPDEVRTALSGANDVWLASCKDFYASPYALKKGSSCPVAVWGCLECPNAVFTTRHLPSILSFLAFLEEQREEYSIQEWKARYGLAWERIVHGIRPKFSDQQIVTAQAIAEANGPSLALPVQFLEIIT